MSVPYGQVIYKLFNCLLIISSQLFSFQIEDLNGQGQTGKIAKDREFTDKASFGTLTIYLVLVVSLTFFI